MSKHGWALAWLLVGCASTDGALARGPIVDGTPAPDDDAVVSVIGSGFCSGTLIAPRLVLTAKHCVVPEGAPGPVPATGVRVGIGPEWLVTRASYDVEAILTTPGPLSISLPPNPVTGATGTDIALLVLTEEVEGVEPIPVRRGDPSDLVGMPATAVGYGRTRTDGGGRKNTVSTTIREVTSVLVGAVDTICQGDSGGPLLVGSGATREVVGVASFGVYSASATEPPCPAAADYWNRVDVQMELIDRALVRSGACVTGVDETCNGLDDDCDAHVDETCAVLGETCATDADCAFGPLPEALAAEYAGRSVTCESVGGESVCALGCDALTPHTSCLSIEHPFRSDVTELDGWVCGRAAGCEGLCVRETGERRTEGAACAADGECASARCEAGACGTPCPGDRGVCPSDEVCLASAGTCGVCADPAARPSERGRGEPCASADECASGVCTEGRCSLPCVMNTDCGPDFHCDFDHCAPGASGGSGDPCVEDADCGGSGSCVRRDGAMPGEPGSFCARACPSSGRCSVGACVLIGESSFCVPAGAVPGEPCATSADCLRSECVDAVCALPCGEVGAGCPSGLVCERSADGTAAYCAPPSTQGSPAVAVASGCGCTSVGSQRGAGGLALLAAGAVLGLARRRRRR